MTAAKAVRTMVSVTASGVFRNAKPAAYFAGEAVRARMRFVITLLILFSFVFTIHCFVPRLKSIYQNAERNGGKNVDLPSLSVRLQSPLLICNFSNKYSFFIDNFIIAHYA